MVATAGATPPPLAIAITDPFTNTTSQHHTAVEPDSFSWGTTMVSVAQVGRFYDGGASDIGWGTSTNGGTSWTRGTLPGITKFRSGPYDRVSDPSVAYDAKHGVWLVASLPLTESPGLRAPAVVVNSSTDGIHWTLPVTVATSSDMDKNWIVCDNWVHSPYYGRCYVEWDNANGLVLMNASTDGGKTWGPSRASADKVHGLGGQPLARPNGSVIVPLNDYDQTSIRWFMSTDGGTSWTGSKLVSNVPAHNEAGGLRSSPLPSAEIDAGGKIYLVWQDCRFRPGCASNDIVMSTFSLGSTAWNAVKRIPIDPTSSTVDHFIPGIAVDRASSGASARLGLAYYLYPSTNCSFTTCRLKVGFVGSTNGGQTWTVAQTISPDMRLGWLADTSQGEMVGDYISTSFVGGKVFPFFSVARVPPLASTFNQLIQTTATGLTP